MLNESAPFSVHCRWFVGPDFVPRPGPFTVEGNRIYDPTVRSRLSHKIDLGNVLVLCPGLANAHTHLEFSDLLEPLGQPGMPLPDWIQHVVAKRRSQNASDTKNVREKAIRDGAEHALRSGTTVIGEIATAPWESAWTRDVGEFSGVSFLELLTLDADRVAPLLRSAESHLANIRTPWAGGLSPHAPYSVHPDLLEGAIQLSRRRRVGVAMHLAESQEERELLATGGGAFRVMLESFGAWRDGIFDAPRTVEDYIQSLAKAHRGLVVHGNYLTADEIDLVARHDNLSVVYCPRTHQFFQHDPYPLAKLLAMGVRVAFGTDSRASNPDLSLWHEVLAAADSHPNVRPIELIRAATQNGREALGKTCDRKTLRTNDATVLCEPKSQVSDPWEFAMQCGRSRSLGDAMASG